MKLWTFWSCYRLNLVGCLAIVTVMTFIMKLFHFRRRCGSGGKGGGGEVKIEEEDVVEGRGGVLSGKQISIF